MRHPLQYRYIRHWYRRHGPFLRLHGGHSLTQLSRGILVLGYGGKLTIVLKAR